MFLMDWSKAKLYLVLAGSILVAAASFGGWSYYKGYSSASVKAEITDLKEELSNHKLKDKVREQTQSLSDSALCADLGGVCSD